MQAAVQLGTSVDALAALVAHLRVQTEDVAADPRVRELLAEIAAEITGGPATDPGAAGPPVIGLARTWLRQAAELIENPGRSGSWDQVDVPLLQSIGRVSMPIADAISQAEDSLGMLKQMLATPGARFLDVGTGTAWLAIAMARSHPALHVVGIDIFAPALELAKNNVLAEGMTGRVELLRHDVTELDADATYDAIWLPMPFLPAPVAQQAIMAALGALRPDGWLLAGTFAGTDDRLSSLLMDLRTVRSGGHPWAPEELVAAISNTGFADVGEVTRAWSAPVRLYAGRRP